MQVHVLTRNRGTVYIFLLPGVKAGLMHSQSMSSLLGMPSTALRSMPDLCGEGHQAKGILTELKTVAGTSYCDIMRILASVNQF